MNTIYTAKKPLRRLGIVSDAHHYKDKNGRLYVLAPVARQFEQWAALFSHVTVCAPLLPGEPPSTHARYEAANIRLIPIREAGGSGVRAKLHLLGQMFRWMRALNRLYNSVDAVHIRCPNNISIPGLWLLHLRKLPREAVYTGTWRDYDAEPFFYKWQRLWLRDKFNGPVAVYGKAEHDPPHIVETFSPSYSRAIWNEEHEAVAARLARLREYSALPAPIRLVCVGWLSENKNQRVAIEAVRLLKERGLKAQLDLLGDGDQREALQHLARQMDVEKQVVFHGHADVQQVRAAYRAADFLVQPSRAEGYGKVVLEAMTHGCVPLLSDTVMSRVLVGASTDARLSNELSVRGGERGASFPFQSAEALAALVAEYSANCEHVAQMVEAGRAYTQEHTLEAWREHLRSVLERYWGAFCP